MAEGKPGNERLRLAVLLTVLAVVVIVAAVRFLGGRGVGGGVSRSSALDYQARNLQPLETGAIGPQSKMPYRLLMSGSYASDRSIHYLQASGRERSSPGLLPKRQKYYCLMNRRVISIYIIKLR